MDTLCLTCDGPRSPGVEVIECGRCHRWAHLNQDVPIFNSISECKAVHPDPEGLLERFLDGETTAAWLATCKVCAVQCLPCCLEMCNCEASHYSELPEMRYHICKTCAIKNVCVVCEKVGNDYAGPSCETMNICPCGNVVCWRHEWACSDCEETDDK